MHHTMTFNNEVHILSDSTIYYFTSTLIYPLNNFISLANPKSKSNNHILESHISNNSWKEKRKEKKDCEYVEAEVMILKTSRQLGSLEMPAIDFQV